MAFALFTRVPELDLARYDRMMFELDLDVNPPAGAILHIASEGAGSINVCEVWQTREAAESFVERRLRDAVSAQGVQGAALLPDRAVAQPVRSGHGHDRAHRQQLVAGRHRSGPARFLELAARRGEASASLQGLSARASARAPVHFTAVFDALSDRLQATLGDLGRAKRLDEDAVNKAMREIRLALLEADVNFQVVKDFVAGVKAAALGDDILKGLDAGQQVVKLVHDRLTELMGTGDSQLAFGRPPTVILMTGLQGSGKTTTSAKLALHLRRDGRKPGLIAADLQRPAAIDQLEQLGKQISIPVYRTDTQDPVQAATEGLERAKADGLDVVIVDTAGRLNVDQALMEELARVRDAVKPLNVLLVLDAMTGQEAVNVAEAFQEHISFDGVVLTKLDGDARGGAALSVKAITGKPIKFASVGEKLDQLEVFHPDRMASRILGMGDVLTLIEKAEAAVEQDEQEEMERRMRAGEFTFDDFLQSYRMLRRMGPVKGVLKLVPGMGNQLDGLDIDEKQMARVEAIVLSMTPNERRVPHLINGPRRRRIAAGSGTSIDEVNKLLAARKQMQKMMKQFGKGKMPTLPPELTGGAGGKRRR